MQWSEAQAGEEGGGVPLRQGTREANLCLYLIHLEKYSKRYAKKYLKKYLNKYSKKYLKQSGAQAGEEGAGRHSGKGRLRQGDATR